MSTTDILNFIRVDERVLTGGQPTAAQLRDAAAEGVEVVINLAPAGGPGAPADEAAVVGGLGLAYHHIPVPWDAPSEADFEKFAQAMTREAGRRVLVHCVANYRATAFYSLYALQALGWNEAQAEALRARIWRPGQYPVWDALIRRLTARLAPPPG